MSTFEVRTFDAAGNQDKILAGARIEFTDEFGGEGYVKVTLPRSASISYGLTHRTEVAVFLDGEELPGSRAFLVETQGNPSSSPDAPGEASEAVWGGRTMQTLLKRVAVYPAQWPVVNNDVKNHVFADKTPGHILKTLFDAAVARGGAPDMTYGSFSAAADSAGVGWAKTLKLEYRPDTDMKSVVENMIRLSAVEFRWVGRDFRVYNADSYGMDWTTGSSPICLYRGREVSDSPYSETSDEIVNAILVIGDDGNIIERTDLASIAQYGRYEGILSQGGTKDTGMLTWLADSTLARSSQVRGEYTVKIEPTVNGPEPFTNYRAGDWVLYDRVAGQPPERFRVRQISVTSDDDSHSVVVTLNDKFAELDLRTQKKIDGILGGAAMEGSTPVSLPDEDTTIPSPPTGVGTSSGAYTDPASKQTRAVALTSWLGPTTNTDGSVLRDLESFDVEEQVSFTATYAPLSEWHPGRADLRLQARWDRRGKDTINGWVGGDGGMSVRADGGDDWFFWSDTLWGTVDAKGKMVTRGMPRSSITKSDPNTLNDLRSFAGVENLVPEGISCLTDAAGTWAVANVDRVVESGAGGYENRWLKATSTNVATSYAYRLLPQGSVVAGKTYLLMAKIDPGTAGANARFYVSFYNSAGAQISSSTQSIAPDGSGWAKKVVAAPTDATTCYVMLYLGAAPVGAWARISYIGVFQTNTALQSWHPPVHHDTWVNEVTNPDGKTQTATATETRRNWLTNPALYQNLTGWSATSGATIRRVDYDVPGVRTQGSIPEIVGASALAPWFADLAQAGTKSVGIGVFGDSATESTGSDQNTDLSDRYIETLQMLLRRDTAVPGVPLRPDGYHGASAYIPVGYLHTGPSDWTFQTADANLYPLRPIQSNISGPGGRSRILEPGHRASFTATFDSFRLSYAPNGYGRLLRISVDGTEAAVIDTFGHGGSATWDSASYGSAEHTVVFEYLAKNGLPQGLVDLQGVDLFDGDKSKGVRVYDFSGSGKAAQDLATYHRQVTDSITGRPLSLVTMMLGFNDFGRDAAWGGPRTAAQFKADIQSAISRMRTAGYSGPILLIGQWQGSNLTPGTAGETQANFRAKLREIAVSDPKVAFIDLSTVMPETASVLWGQDNEYVDGLHPSMKGHARVAEILHGVLAVARSNEPGTALVKTTGSGAQQGVSISDTGITTTSFPVGSIYAVGAWVKAPSGTLLDLRHLAPGNTGGTVQFTGTGSWQFVKSDPVAVASGATGGPYLIVRTRTAQAVDFLVSKAIIVKSNTVEGYFDGASPSTDSAAYSWAGTAGASAALERRLAPSGVTSNAGSATYVTTFDPATYDQGAGSVLVTVTGGSASAYRLVQHPVSVPVGKTVTLVAMVKTEGYTPDQFLLRAMASDGSTYIGGSSPVLTKDVRLHDNGWYEVRWTGVLDQAATSARLVVYATAPIGSKTWVSEFTAVATDGFEYRGGPFHGGQTTGGIDTSWQGSPHASKSTLEAHNSSSNTAGNASSLLHPAAAGGNASEYVWLTDAVRHPTAVNKVLVVANGMRNRATRGHTVWNFQRTGTIYLAEWDMGTDTLTQWVKWFDDPNVQWGDALWVENGYLYLYGASGVPGKQHVMRVPAIDVLNGSRQVWSGGLWKMHGTAVPDVIGTMADGGSMTGVRTFNGQWIGLHTSGYMTELHGYTAPAPQGPWTRLSTPVYKFPQGSSYSLKYVPRFYPQWDTQADGVAYGFSESGQNGNEVYGQTFLRGPSAARVPLFNDEFWTERRSVETSPDSRGGLVPGASYAARVRSRDQSGNVSDWAYGTPILLKSDTVAPPKPATPLVTGYFRGIRIQVSGLAASGAAMPTDFDYLSVHVSADESFTPSQGNLVDTLPTRGGISVVQDLWWGTTYYVKIVAWDTTGNPSEPSAPASAEPERLSDPDLPDKLIDGAKHIKDESLSVRNFTVGALGDGLVPNGNMEEWDGSSRYPTGWRNGWHKGNPPGGVWEDGAAYSVDESNPISGSRSLRVDVPAESTLQVLSTPFPVTPGDVYYVSAKVRTEGKLPSDLLQLGVQFGVALSNVNEIFTPLATSKIVGVSDGGSRTVLIEGQVEVPDFNADGSGSAMHWAAVDFTPYHLGDRGYRAWLDDVTMKQVVGEAAIANASINRAKIRYLAVDDARISSMSVGKLVAGELWADITVSARIMTSKTGQRVELNRDGLFGYNSGEDLVTQIRSSDGGIVSKWIRTNTTGTRIELGTYGMGAGSALMSFFPAAGVLYPSEWQFPPALGFGGDYRQGSIPGLAMHAGSLSEAKYQKHGMNMIAVDQVGGITLVTGNLLNSTAATHGAPIIINAGGSDGYVELRSGGTGTNPDPARLVLHPDAQQSFLSLHRGRLQFLSSTTETYLMRFVYGTEWLGFNHLLADCGGGGFRFKTGNEDSIIISASGLLRGNGPWSTPKIKIRNDDRYISWDGSGNAYIGGATSPVKTFVIPHPLEEDKYLVHAAHEGDEMRVIYEGVAHTVDGEAVVTLPAYFEELTEAGTDVVFAQALLCSCEGRGCSVKPGRVTDGQFRVVACGTTAHDVEFSWRVTAVRRGTDFATEPRREDVSVSGDGPYTYITTTRGSA